MDAISIVSVALIGLLIIGFVLGFARSWKKSLVRFGIVLGCILFALLLTKPVSSLIMNNYVNGLVVTIFGVSINFEEVANAVLGDSSFIADLFAPNSVTTKVATAFMNVVVNLLIYIVIFIVLFLISFIIYSIISIIVTIRKKNSPEEQKPVKIWERFIGGGIGIFGILLMCLVLFTPVFGVMSVCNEFIDKDNKTANAYNATSFVSAGLYYQSKPVETVESYITEYVELKESYDQSFAGFVFKWTGTDFLGKTAFKKLTVVKFEGLTFDFVSECVNFIGFYNQYKTTFVENKFDLSNTASVDNLKDLYSYTKESEVMRSYIVELVPKFSEKWSNDQKYFGIEFPIQGNLAPVAKKTLNVFNTTSYTQIDQAIEIVFEVIDTANNYNSIADYKNGEDIEKILTKNDTLVKEEILVMSKSSRFRKQLPEIMTAMIELEYKKMVGDPTGKIKTPSLDTEAVDWNKEADIMQFISNNLFRIYLENKESDNDDVLRNNLTEIGMSIDKARESQIIKDNFKIFMVDYITSSNFDMKESVKIYALNLIEENWEDPTYKFEDSFSALEETAKMIEGVKEMDFDSMKTALTNIVRNENAKDALKSAINNGVIDDLASGNQTKADVMKEMILSFTEISSNEETVEDDIDATIKAGNEISGLVDASQSPTKTFEYEGETEEEKKEDATKMMENIAGSKTVMNNISKDDSAAALAVDGLVIDEEITEYGIDNANISDEDKNILRKFFNID